MAVVVTPPPDSVPVPDPPGLADPLLCESLVPERAWVLDPPPGGSLPLYGLAPESVGVDPVVPLVPLVLGTDVLL